MGLGYMFSPTILYHIGLVLIITSSPSFASLDDTSSLLSPADAHINDSALPPSIAALESASPSPSEALNTSSPTYTPYEVLNHYDFPVGLLPKGALGYELDNSTGRFTAFLDGGDDCTFSLEGSYQLKYKSTIKGQISKGKLSDLKGVSVKLFFMWVEISEVLRSDDDLEFSAGIAGAGFPVSNFEESPQCGCGLSCNTQQVRKIRTTLIGSSS